MDNQKPVPSKEIIDHIDSLIYIKIDLQNVIAKLKKLTPFDSGREKAITITKVEEAVHRITDAYIIDKDKLI